MLDNYFVITLILLIIVFAVFCSALLFVHLKLSRSIFIKEELNSSDNFHVGLTNCCANKLSEIEIAKSDILSLFALVDFNEIENREISMQQGEIWILTYDLEVETADDGMSKVVLANLQKGIKYCYFTPFSDENQVNIESLKKKYASFADLVEIVKIAEDDFMLGIATYDAIIYNPFSESKAYQKGYLSIGTIGHYTKWLYREIPYNDLKSLVGKLKSLKMRVNSI
jgi:hypothetical protein